MMDKYIAKITENTPIVHIYEPDRDKRALLHEEMKKYPSYRLCSKYSPSGYQVRCDNCGIWNSTENSHNGCCGDDNPGCNSTSLRVLCKRCFDFVYFESESDELDDPKLRPGLWRSTGYMIVMSKKTNYKYLNTRQSSYRKRYRNQSK